MNKTRSPRAFAVELLRLIACLIVIGVHTLLPYSNSDAYKFWHTFLSCLVADGVAVFWMITGCFLFKRKVMTVWKHAIRTIGLPLVIATCLGWVLSYNQAPGFNYSDFSALKNSLFCFAPAVPGMTHLWYLYVNLFVLALFPLLKLIVTWIDLEKRRQLLFVLVAVLLFIVNDISGNRILQFGFGWNSGFIPAIIEMILGHLIYKYLRNWNSRKPSIVFFLIFVITNLLRATVFLTASNNEPSNYHVLYWYSFFGLLCAASLMLGIFSAVNCVKTQSKKNKPIYLKAINQRCVQTVYILASYSFLIYIIHYPLLIILNGMGFQTWVETTLLPINYGFKQEIQYWFSMVTIVFTLSLLVSYCIRSFFRWVVSIEYQTYFLQIVKAFCRWQPIQNILVGYETQ